MIVTKIKRKAYLDEYLRRREQHNRTMKEIGLDEILNEISRELDKFNQGSK